MSAVLKVINVAQDPRFSDKRLRNLSDVTQAPILAGKVLRPRTSRMFSPDELTPELFSDILRLEAAGVLQAIVFLRPPVGLDKLWEALGKAPLPTAPELPGAEIELPEDTDEEAPEPEAEEAAPEETGEQAEGEDGEDAEEPAEEDEAPSEEEPAAIGEQLPLDEILEPAPEEPAEEVGPDLEEFTVPEDLAERLHQPRVVTNEELRSMLAILDRSGAGKNKSELIEDLVAALSADDLDPVKGHRVMELLDKAEQE